MTMSQHIDYVSTYFPHKVPIPIRGEPTHKDLKRLKTELRANASSVDSTLGGGDHGYLGLVLSDVEYLAIPTVNGTPFVPPAYPGPLVIPPTANAMQAVQARESHQEQVRQCHAVDTGPLAATGRSPLVGVMPQVQGHWQA